MRPLGTALVLVAALLLALPAVPAAAADPTPEEYGPEEFPQWMRDLRRGEIVAFGSLPFTLFFVTLGYDGVRYLVHSSDLDAARYAPWPFRSTNPVPYSSGETIGVGLGVLACSIAVAVADYLIGRSRERRAAPR